MKLIIIMSIAFMWLTLPGPLAKESEDHGDLANKAEVDFSGDWDWLEPAEGKSFFIRLEQEGDKLVGRYCATAFYGSRVDCGVYEGACRIEGTVIGDKANIEFKSCYGGMKGKAKLIHQENQIQWTILEAPIGRWYFCPQKAVLEKAIKIWKDVSNRF